MKINIFFKKVFMVVCSCLLLGLLNACAPNLGASDYVASNVGDINYTLKGIIVATRNIKIRPDHSEKAGAGASAGAVSGALLGSTLGGGINTKIATGVIGGLAGGLAGHAIEKKLSEQNGIEYQIKLINDGKIITLTQGLEPKMSVGQKVLVIKNNRYNGRSRVIPDNT